MAEIDGRLAPIIEAVLRSPLAPLGRSAIERLVFAESERWSPDEEQDPLAPREDEGSEERARRQLRILNEVIGGRLKLELSLFDANLRLSREIAAGIRGRGAEAFATVVVIDNNEEAPTGEIGGENLLTGLRRERLLRTLDVWRRVVEAADGSIDGPLER